MSTGMANQATIAAIDPVPRRERSERLRALIQGVEPQGAVPWRGGHIKTPIVSVDIALPVYRVQNGRLAADLSEQARGGGQAPAALAAREDEAGVQRMLHDLLVAKARDNRGPIYQELQRQALQTEPLLVSADGVVVNGNRRLAAMRELLREDSQRFASFSRLSVAVLPADATTQDLESLEAALQMAPETKLAYSWIARRLKLRQQRDDLKLPIEVICEASRLDGPPQLDAEIAELELVDDYLQNYCGEPGRYSLVVNARNLFTPLRDRLHLLPEELREVWRHAAFAMIHGRAWVRRPMDRQFPFAAPVPEHLPAWALRRFAEERGLTAGSTGPDTAAPSAGERQDLITVFADRSNANEIAPALAELLERLRIEHTEQHNPVRLLKLLEKAEKTMRDLAPENLNERQREILRRQLAAMQAQVEFLLGEQDQPA